jgi:hypothetical protein
VASRHEPDADRDAATGAWLAGLRDTMSGPAWEPAPEALVAAAKAAFTWRTIDADLASLSYDSLLDLAAAGVRRAGDGDAVLVFEGAGARLVVLLAAGAARGQLVPAEAATVTLLGPDGELGRYAVAGDGRFDVPLTVGHAVRLRLDLGGGSLLTSWFRGVPSWRDAGAAGS